MDTLQHNLACCPFCGKNGQPELMKQTDGGMPGSQVTEAFVKCKKCGSTGKHIADWSNPNYREQSVDAWNTRGCGITDEMIDRVVAMSKDLACPLCWYDGHWRTTSTDDNRAEVRKLLETAMSIQHGT